MVNDRVFFEADEVSGEKPTPKMVPRRGLEPPRLTALASKTSVSAIPPPGQKLILPRWWNGRHPACLFLGKPEGLNDSTNWARSRKKVFYPQTWQI